MNTIENDNPNDTPNTEAVDLAEKTVNEDAKKQLEEKYKKASIEIEEVLVKHNMALKLSLSITPNGILPMANLVKIPEKKEETKPEVKKDDK